MADFAAGPIAAGGLVPAAAAGGRPAFAGADVVAAGLGATGLAGLADIGGLAGTVAVAGAGLGAVAPTGILAPGAEPMPVCGDGFDGRGGAALPAPSGVPQRAQNLNVAAFKVVHFGHCFGGAPAASRAFPEAPAVGAAGDLAAIICAPQDTHDPTPVSLAAPQRGHSMAQVVSRARKRGQGAARAGFFEDWRKPPLCGILARGEGTCPRRLPPHKAVPAARVRFHPALRSCAYSAARRWV
jgi:hypothetical protein